MKNHGYLRFSGLMCLVLLFTLSCAGGGSNPITPGGNSPNGLTPGSEDDGTLTPPTAQNSGGALNESGPSIWGLYNIIYDNTTGGFEIEPLRGAQITLNVLGFLQPPIGSPANLGLQITDPSKFGSEGILKLNISITHPFKLARLVGFDTMGVLIGNGGPNFQEESSVIVAGANELHLLNADGYTRWMNPVEFTESGVGGYIEGALGAKGQTWTATVNSYKYFASGIGIQENVGDYLSNGDNILNRGAYFPQTTLTREYEIKFPYTTKPQVKFQYAILTHFQAALDDQGDPIKQPVIDDFEPGANAQEAAYISADTSTSTLYYDPEHLNGGGKLEIILTVYDWQGMESLGGTGAFSQIGSIGFGSWDNLFGTTGLVYDSAALDGTEQSSTANSTTLKLEIQGLAPGKVGPHDIFIAVYSADPVGYGPNLGKPYPKQAKLAAYARTTVNVIENIVVPPNNPPIIDEIQGLTEVDCWSGPTEYTCIAHDDDPGDTIQYEAQCVPIGDLPFFKFIYTDDPTYTIDWSDEDKNPPGLYMLFFQVTDGKDTTIGPPALITKSENAIKLNYITADPEDVFNVFCSNIDAVYTCDYDYCGQPPLVSFRWLKGTGDPPVKPNPADPGWTELSESPQIVLSWDGTAIGDWWLICSAVGDFGTLLTPYLLIERVDSPPTNVNPPEGATEVDCNMTAEEYALTGGDDCDGGEITREWTLTVTDQEPTEGWLIAYNEVFYVNWSVYDIGTYFLWQRVGTGSNYTVTDPLEVHRVNTGPDSPNPPSGPTMVSCTDTSTLYQAGVVGDCEDDPLTRQWALGSDINPPTSGWTDFSGTTFYVDFSEVPNGLFGLFQRASDDGLDWAYSAGSMVNKKNATPDKPDTPDGPTNVTCHDSAAEYLAGTASDCDSGDTLTRYWGVSFDTEFPPMDWFEFTGDSFEIDWSQYLSSLWYVFQKTVDSSLQENASAPVAVLKSNSAPEVGPPTGPTEVSCTDTGAEYFETTMEDCDPATTLIKSRYLSTNPDTPSGGSWMYYTGESFIIDFSKTASGDFYLFLKAFDTEAETVSDPLHILKNNTPPETPQVPDGPTEIDCEDIPLIYEGGSMSDCDIMDVLARYYYLSTNPLTPTGGTWIMADTNPFIVDLSGVIAEEYYYLFQKITDGMDETLSDSLEIIYHNSAPIDPLQPSGDTTVSCVNDNEQYLGKSVFDCDSWQTLTREWAAATSDWPPAIGWTAFTGEDFYVDWSLFDEGTYYLFQRVYDDFEHAYSESLQVEVGPPSLIQPPIPDGPEDLICDDPVTTYDAGSYLAGCPGLSIVRTWAYNNVPTPPGSGWTVFTGTTFDIDPAVLGV
ncbi:MAG: hypothetical protein ABIC40_07860, partial [bacterium]